MKSQNKKKSVKRKIVSPKAQVKKNVKKSSQKISQKSQYFVALYSSKIKSFEDYFKTKSVDSEIRDQQKHILFSQKKVKAPEQWSQTAIDIAASKYFRKSIAEENSIFKLISRIASGLETAFKESKLLDSQEVKSIVHEIQFHLLNQSAVFNSPVWFNCGLYETYKAESPTHHYAWFEKQKKVGEVRNAFFRPQVSACFIQSIEDSLESIFDLVKTEAKLFKYGSGSGTNFSPLRSKYENLNAGGSSSGLISFLEVLDKSAGAIKSGGTTRRAAKMVCLDADHPEIIEFIRWKSKEEKKAKILIQAGYSAALDGEAYHTVSGQNANNSVRLTDAFMQAVEKDLFWNLNSRVKSNSKAKSVVIKKIKARVIWQALCQSAWECADPGVQFDSTIQKYHTCKESGRIQASNPCSEYMFLDNSACNLASINLTKFIDYENLHSENQVAFKWGEFLHTVKTFILAQEALVDYASYPTAQIAQNSHDYRPLGLGFANLGSCLMQMGIAYSSDTAQAFAGAVTALMTGMAYYTSTEMAEKKGPFAGFKKNKKSMLDVMKLHEANLNKINWKLLPPDLEYIALELWGEVIDRGQKYGFRNSQVTVIAPTGTIGLVMDCDTTGIEPDFSLIKFKKLSGGGMLKIVNQSVEKSLKVLGYSSVQIQKITQALEEEKNIFTSEFLKPEHYSIFFTAAGTAGQVNDILSVEAHLGMMQMAQYFISGAISKTVNLPHESTLQDIEDVYMKAWKLGLKAVALYRDGSKFVQPVVKSLDGENQNAENSQQLNFDHFSEQNKLNQQILCTICGFPTILESGCYRCTNCGTTTACTG